VLRTARLIFTVARCAERSLARNRERKPPVKLVARQKLDAIQRPFVARSRTDERARGWDESLARSLAREMEANGRMRASTSRRENGSGERMNRDSHDEMISLGKTAHVSSDCGIILFIKRIRPSLNAIKGLAAFVLTRSSRIGVVDRFGHRA